MNSGDQPATPTTTEAEVPGFGIVVAALALGAAILLYLRRR